MNRLAPRASPGPWSLDAVDTQLLTLLAVDARASLRSLGAAVGLSGPSVADRIQRLTERGVIRGFTVDIDWDLLGVPTLAHISLLTDKSSHIETIVNALRNVDRVEEISIVTGATDLLVRARVADLSELRRSFWWSTSGRLPASSGSRPPSPWRPFGRRTSSPGCSSPAQRPR